MKKHFSLVSAVILAIACLCLASSGCINIIDKLNPQKSITLYSANGEVIRTWKGRISLKPVNGILVNFETEEGKEVSISGTIVIEEIQR